MRREYLPLLLILAALAAVGVRPRGDSSGESRRGIAAGPATDDYDLFRIRTDASENFLQPIDDFSRGGGADAKSDEAAVARVKKNLDEAFPNNEIECLIALLPDPVASKSGYWFDPALEAIELAIEKAGPETESPYTLDRFWLPWPHDGDLDLDALRAAMERNSIHRKVAKSLLRTPRRPTSERYEYEPGVIVFRRVAVQEVQKSIADQVLTGGQQPTAGQQTAKKQNVPNDKQVTASLLVLFVVGDSPTRGVHKEALVRSLRSVEALKEPSKSAQAPTEAPKKEILIIGPTFSGSKDSLAIALRQWARGRGKNDSPIVKIRSSATSIKKGWLEAASQPPTGAGNELVVDFKPMVVPDWELRASLFEYLQKQQILRPKIKIALLTEMNTGYGQAAMHGTKIGSDDPILITVPFPLHISRVHAAHDLERQRLLQDLPRLSTSAPPVQMPIETEESAGDTIAAYSPPMTAATADAVLARLMELVRHEDIRYVGIITTDVRDKMFLASLVKEHCPDVQLVTTMGDVLFANQDHNDDLRGMIVASSYSLFAPSQLRHSTGERQRLFFASQSYYGMYNGTLALLRKDQKELFEFDESRPWVWISVVGRDDIYPVAVERSKGSGTQGAKDPKKDDEKETPGFGSPPAWPVRWIAVSCGMAAFAVWVCLSYYAPLFRPQSPDFSHLSRLICPVPKKPKEAWPRARVFVLLSFSLLAVFYGYVSVVWRAAAIGHSALGVSSIFGMAWSTFFIIIIAALVIALPLDRLFWRALSGTKEARQAAPSSVETPAAESPSTPVPAAASATNGNDGSTPSANASPQVTRLVLLIAVALAVVAAVIISLFVFSGERGDSIDLPLGSDPFLFERAIGLDSGVSLLLPLFCFTFAVAYFLYIQIQRVHLLGDISWRLDGDVPERFPDNIQLTLEKVWSASKKCEDFLHWRARRGALGTLLVIMVAALMWRILRLVPTFDRGWYQVLVIEFALAVAGIAVSTLQFVYLWQATKKLMAAIMELPMRPAFTRLPASVSELISGYLTGHEPHDDQKVVVARYCEYLQKRWPYVVQSSGLPLNLSFATASSECSLINNAINCVRIAACNVWPSSDVAAQFPARRWLQGKRRRRPDRAKRGSARPLGDEPALRDWAKTAEEFFATVVVLHLAYFFLQLKRWMWFITIGTILVIVGTGLYVSQLQPLLLLVWTLAVVIIGAVLWVFWGINLNELLSFLSHSTPNSFTIDRGFLPAILTFIIPLVLALAAQVGGLPDGMLAWLDQFLLHR